MYLRDSNENIVWLVLVTNMFPRDVDMLHRLRCSSYFTVFCSFSAFSSSILWSWQSWHVGVSGFSICIWIVHRDWAINNKDKERNNFTQQFLFYSVGSISHLTSSHDNKNFIHFVKNNSRYPEFHDHIKCKMFHCNNNKDACCVVVCVRSCGFVMQ